MKTLKQRKKETLMGHPVYLLQMPGAKDKEGDQIWNTIMVFLDGEEATEYMEAREYRFQRGRVRAYPAGGCLRSMLDYDGERMAFKVGKDRYTVGIDDGEFVVRLGGHRMELGI
tara:strand:+ start:22 stop:363 length:342 start_codon:yes stop_codon:yes gene_type:complete